MNQWPPSQCRSVFGNRIGKIKSAECNDNIGSSLRLIAEHNAAGNSCWLFVVKTDIQTHRTVSQLYVAQCKSVWHKATRWLRVSRVGTIERPIPGNRSPVPDRYKFG